MNCETRIGIDDKPDPEQIAELLDRYPRISEAERDLVLTFLRQGRWLDIGLLSSRDTLKPKLREFQQDHARQLGLQARDYLLAAFLVTLVLIASILLWDAAL